MSADKDKLMKAPYQNPLTGKWEYTFRAPDGYVVVIEKATWRECYISALERFGYCAVMDTQRASDDE